MPTFALILPAAGKSTRFGGARSKLLEDLGGQSVISRAIQPFLDRADLAQVVIPTADPEGLSTAVPKDSRISFCQGGATRAHSVLAALRQVSADVEWVAVHDAARPLISPELIEQTLAAAAQHGAAVPALPVALTIKQATGPLPSPVDRTVPRQSLWAMQTPQVMRRTALLDAFTRCPIPLDHVTDDVQLLELADYAVWLINGQERNLKVTTAVDLVVAKWWLEQDKVQS
jgi:2-C-methyl-D-erythritol 4-phosphate cytidylyltransferase